jgi:hypothetical protein
MLAGVPLAIVGGFIAQWWHPALWIGAAALLPGMLFGVYAFAGLTMIPDRAQFWTVGMFVAALLGALASGGSFIGAPIGMGVAAGLRLFAEAVNAGLRLLGYRVPIEG